MNTNASASVHCHRGIDQWKVCKHLQLSRYRQSHEEMKHSFGIELSGYGKSEIFSWQNLDVHHVFSCRLYFRVSESHISISLQRHQREHFHNDSSTLYVSQPTTPHIFTPPTLTPSSSSHSHPPHTTPDPSTTPPPPPYTTP